MIFTGTMEEMVSPTSSVVASQSASIPWIAPSFARMFGAPSRSTRHRSPGARSLFAQRRWKNPPHADPSHPAPTKRVQAEVPTQWNVVDPALVIVTVMVGHVPLSAHCCGTRPKSTVIGSDTSPAPESRGVPDAGGIDITPASPSAKRHPTQPLHLSFLVVLAGLGDRLLDRASVSVATSSTLGGTSRSVRGSASSLVTPALG